MIISKGLENGTAKFYRCVITQAITKTITYNISGIRTRTIVSVFEIESRWEKDIKSDRSIFVVPTLLYLILEMSHI
jgi:hypothetical protein